jgi:hypothetical protein
MFDRLLFALALFSALGCGLVAGVFFAFSSFVMNALARLPAAQGIAAMQSINVVVINPLFMTAFLGTAAACVLLAISSVLRLRAPGASITDPGGEYPPLRCYRIYFSKTINLSHIRRSRCATPFDQLITQSLPPIT